VIATMTENRKWQTGHQNLTGSMTFRMTVPTANLGFSTTSSTKKLSPVDYDNDRQPEMAISGSRSLSQCNHLANLLSRWILSKIRNLELEFRRCLSEFPVLAAILIFPVVGHCCTYLPKLFSTDTWSYTPDLSLELLKLRT